MKHSDYESMSTSELVEIYKMGSDREKDLAMELIIVKNDNLVFHIINTWFPSYVHSYIDDMRQEGRQAIFLHAADFDPEKGTFSTFITPYIKDAIKMFICGVHGISTHYSAQIKRYRKAIHALEQRGIENPTFGDIAEEMGVGLDAVQRVHEVALRMNPISIEGDDKDKELCSAFTSSPDVLYEHEEFKNTIADAINSLPKEERAVILESFFSESGKETTLIDVAHRLHSDVSTVRRLKNRALRRLQDCYQLSDYGVSRKRRQIDDFGQSLTITFSLPPKVVDTNISIALSLDDDECEELHI